MKFAICNEIFQGWKIDDVLRARRKVGYDAVEIAPFTLAELRDGYPAGRAAADPRGGCAEPESRLRASTGCW